MDIGWKNFIAMKDKGFDNILVHPDGELHRKLALLAFDLYGDGWDPYTVKTTWPGIYLLNLMYHLFLVKNAEPEYGRF